jgi:hypothetical protein
MLTVFNLFSGPGAGKSTTSADLYQHLKRQDVRVELVGEQAKDFLHLGADVQLENQFLLAASQYARLKNLERAGYEVAISDSPLIQGLVYAFDNNCPYFEQLQALVMKVNTEFDNINLYLSRGNRPYQKIGRTQTAEEAKKKDGRIFDAFKHHFHTVFFTHETLTIKSYVDRKLLEKKILGHEPNWITNAGDHSFVRCSKCGGTQGDPLSRHV